MDSDANGRRRALIEQANAIVANAKSDFLTPDEDERWGRLYDQIRAIRAPSMTPSAGAGWRVLDSPRYPHADLEQLARQVWRAAFPWSGGFATWRVRFGVLDGRHEGFAAVTLYRDKLVVIDEARLLQARDLEDDLRESLLHEGVHISVGAADEPEHSWMFHSALNEARERCPRVIGTWTRSR
jgi:hypothetical protein